MSCSLYSDCHFASLTEKDLCSFCGDDADVLRGALTLEHDLELTLRRWKDGDCDLDSMFGRINTELQRSYDVAFHQAQERLQAEGTQVYQFDPSKLEWNRVGDAKSS